MKQLELSEDEMELFRGDPGIEPVVDLDRG
jgi:hypothetical protein